MPTGTRPPRLAFIGCWYRYDMYSDNCCNLVASLRRCGMQVDVVTSNCGCFSTSQRFAVPVAELTDGDCQAIRIPYAPRLPSRKHGVLKYIIVRLFHISMFLDAIRGMLYYVRSRQADIIHYDQVLKAFGCLPLFILTILARISNRPIVVTVHEIDPLQQDHRWINRLYNHCARVLVYSENMKSQLQLLGLPASRISVLRYGATIPQLATTRRAHYIYFGGHNILRGKGYGALLDALTILKREARDIRVLIYVGKGCNGLGEAEAQADERGVSGMIQWRSFMSGTELVEAYQMSKACLVPYTGGSGRHTVTCAMANATPVIATRAVDIPEYLGELGVYIAGDGPSIARAICEIERNATEATALGTQLRRKAVAELSWKGIGENLCGLYTRIAHRTTEGLA